MTRILVTGGAGGLGSELVPRLRAAGHDVRIGSSRRQPDDLASGLEWAQGDLLSGEGLAESVAGIETIVHCASSPFKKTWETDVGGTKRLLEAAKAAGVGHFYFISIVGVDRMTLPYYKAKYAAEKAIEASGIPFTILRATQFHTLLDAFMRQRFKRGPFLFLPGAAKFQLIDTSEVVARMAETVEKGPSGRLPDIGGPEVLTGAEIAKPWLKVSGVRVIRVPVPALGPIGQLAKGLGCCPENKFGVITWAQWLEKTYSRSS
ncbi:MAG: NAD(P)H-binding protein [Chloroflexi bacterium]|nr:NAD(P)H-binding protein [Chloroflexota bacterium]